MNMISEKACFYGNIKIGNNVRIDDFCILTGDITIGDNIHIACFCFLSGQNGIVLEDFTQVGPRSTLLSGSDDFSGLSLIGPTIPDEYKPLMKKGKIIMRKHAVMGAHCVIFPGVIMAEGAALGACSLANRSLPAWTISVGVPAIAKKTRDKTMLQLEEEFKYDYQGIDKISTQGDRRN
jgi:acetyltransferase-like isoleucine patch superfamily enzyme